MCCFCCEHHFLWYHLFIYLWLMHKYQHPWEVYDFYWILCCFILCSGLVCLVLRYELPSYPQYFHKNYCYCLGIGIGFWYCFCPFPLQFHFKQKTDEYLQNIEQRNKHMSTVLLNTCRHKCQMSLLTVFQIMFLLFLFLFLVSCLFFCIITLSLFFAYLFAMFSFWPLVVCYSFWSLPNRP